MNRTLVILVVGLTRKMLGENTPNLTRLAEEGSVHNIRAVTPAVTCSAQATYMTGLTPQQHGIVANGWLFRDTGEVAFWKQSRNLVQGETIWDHAKRINPEFTSARMFWWYNMYDSNNEYSATPRPQYPSDGRKIPDIWTRPPELRDELQSRFGTFPLFHFWGPMASIESSEWITKATSHVHRHYKPTLTLTYLPHLDYPLQKYGPNHRQTREELKRIDRLCGELIEAAKEENSHVIVLSEYGITQTKGKAIAINQALRKAGMIRVREEEAGEVMDPAGSRAFAVCDHQIAHIYVNDPADLKEVQSLLQSIDGIETIYTGAEKKSIQLDHPRSGEIIALAKADRWFSYYYWLEEKKKPDFASTVDIHKKPGYDPAELFIDPAICFPRLKIAWILFKRKLGFRTLLNVIGTKTALIQGSHGRPTDRAEEGPVLIRSSGKDHHPSLPVFGSEMEATDVKGLILDHIFTKKSGSR